jgi:hypothetical protein
VRRVDAQVEAARGTGRRRSWLAFGVAAMLLLAIGAAIGARGSSETRITETLTVTVSRTEGSPRAVPSETTRGVGGASGYARTRQGAAAAATAYVDALDGSALLDAPRLRTTLAAIASNESRAALVQAYERAATQTRERLGVGTAPEPVLILRAVPVGYRIDRFTRDAATVSLWRVGIVGSGASVEPQQSWRTETVSMVWERGGWKVASFRSSTGPTPPLAPSAVTPASVLFATVPEFEELKHAQP